MTYTTGGPIQALDYNTFATLSTGINEVFADDHPGSTTLPDATFGYGQPQLTPVSINNPILASEWALLFDTIRRVGQHQDTTVVPPLPGTTPGFGTGDTDLPAIGDVIVAYAGVSTLIDTLRANRLLLTTDPTQYSFVSSITGTSGTSANSWLTELTYTFQLDFGTWDNTRYFFNSGGFIGINGSYPGAVTPVQIAWANALTDMSPLIFNYNSTTPNVGSGGTAIGFYELTTSYQTIYQRALGGLYYTGSYIEVVSKLDAAAGTNGLIDFQIRLIDGDLTPDIKTSGFSFTISETHSDGAVIFPGTVTGSNTGFVYT